MSYYRTPEHRAQQSAAIQRWRPWEHSTGPKSEDGKAQVSRNAYKGGTRAILRALARLLREQGEALKRIGWHRAVRLLGWRIPFLLSAALVLVGLYVRLRLHATPEFAAYKARGATLRMLIAQVLRQHWHTVLLRLLIPMGTTGLGYVSLVFLLSYGAGTLGNEPQRPANHHHGRLNAGDPGGTARRALVGPGGAVAGHPVGWRGDTGRGGVVLAVGRYPITDPGRARGPGRAVQPSVDVRPVSARRSPG